ncbi:ABC transporter ATP-binding protein [Murimonas intestini]|uniref:ABC transporter ATP-binding protein n=1 Tax=Murimonas intestini TaxID=1337051 RepID=UPI0011DCB017|nr:ABC transporter ATP-binding protein [Murimonas intestini]
MKNGRKTILEIKNMSISFKQYAGKKGTKQIDLPVIRDLSVTIKEGEMVAVVGSSGSGKSLLAHGVLGLLPYNGKMEGKISYCGKPLTPKKVEKLRGNEIVLVPQSVSYLDPLMKVGAQVRGGRKDAAAKERSRELFRRYGLEESVEDLYPFELSGGMARRVLICTALMKNPKLVIADEPTPGLHLEAARQTLSDFRAIADQGAGVLLITHDLELAMEVADRIVVFYAGTTIEEASADDFRQEDTLRHPYSRALHRAIPQNGFGYIEGTQPYVKDMPEGCPFGPRCEGFCEECQKDIPWVKSGNGYVRCIGSLEAGRMRA